MFLYSNIPFPREHGRLIFDITSLPFFFLRSCRIKTDISSSPYYMSRCVSDFCKRDRYVVFSIPQSRLTVLRSLKRECVSDKKQSCRVSSEIGAEFLARGINPTLTLYNAPCEYVFNAFSRLKELKVSSSSSTFSCGLRDSASVFMARAFLECAPCELSHRNNSRSLPSFSSSSFTPSFQPV